MVHSAHESLLPNIMFAASNATKINISSRVDDSCLEIFGYGSKSGD